MFIRKLAVMTAVAAFGLLAMASYASATIHIRTDPGGSFLSGSTTITNTTSERSTLAGSAGNISCDVVKFDADLNANTAASSITGTLTQLTFTTCTDTVPIINFASCHLDTTAGFPSVHITAAAGGGSVQITDPLVRCLLVGGGGASCYFTGTSASAIGTFANLASTLDYTSVAVDRGTGAGDLGAACGEGGTFNAKFTHIVQGGTNRTITITTA